MPTFRNANNNYALEYQQASAVKTASAEITSGKSTFIGILVTNDGTNAVTINIYDNTSGSGTKIVPTLYISASASTRNWALDVSPGLKANTGIYVDVSVAGGGTCEYQVFYGE